jgi:ABC-type multidrug transport system fused ATPase/permease subunit
MIVPTVWGLLDRGQRVRLLGLQLLAVLMAGATVAGITAVLPFFTVLADPAAMRRSLVLRVLRDRFGLDPAGPHLALALGLAFIGLVVLANAVNVAGTLLMSRFAYAVGNSFNVALFEDYITRGYEFHLRIHSATLTARLLHETSRVTAGILQSGLTLAASGVTIALIVGSMILVDPAIATVALLTLGTTYILIYTSARGKLLRNGVEESGRYAERTRIVGESLGAIKEILVARAQPGFAARYAEACRAIARTSLSTLAIAQTPRYALEVATVCALVGGALYLGERGEGRGPWIAALSFMGLAIYRLLPALQQAFTALVRIRADRPALESVARDLRQARARAHEPCEPAANVPWRGRPRREIVLEDVFFRYPSARADALAGVSLRIPAGAIVGLVGDNGSGKTTLLDIVAGVLSPRSGRIAVDGIAIDAANRGAWQSTLAYLPQQVFLLDATLDENIALGAAAAVRDRDRLRSAIALAQLQECAAAGSDAASERLGERGVRLSGGQRQRVGIARALYREASVLIMDEATSELDAAAEQAVVDAIEASTAGRTVILTAHRLSSLKHCDIIYELQGGRLARCWTYEELQAGGRLRPPGRAHGGA